MGRRDANNGLFYPEWPLADIVWVMNAERIFFIALLLTVVLAWKHWEERPVTHAPGVLVSLMPVQTPVFERQFEFDDFELTQRASFNVQARVLSRRDYHLDPGAAIAPTDLALGWGPMSDQAILDQMEVSQSGRWFNLRWGETPSIPEHEIMSHASNMHIIPANDYVGDVLDSVREGQIVQLQGYLVDVAASDGFRWNTSLSRTDTGNGACELFYVERLTLYE